MIREGTQMEEGRSFIEILVGPDGGIMIVDDLSSLSSLGRPSRPFPVTKRFITSSLCFLLSTCLEDNVRLCPFEYPILSSYVLLAVRKAQESQPVDPETITKRTKRHLDELEVHLFRCGSLPTDYLMEAVLRIAL